MAVQQRDARDDTGFHASYAEFAKTVRTWLVAYGVGAPVVFFQAPRPWEALARSGGVEPFVYCFLVGIGLQVLGAVGYKTAMWYLYSFELGKLKASTRRYRWSNAISEAYWLEASLDLSTIALFSYSTLRAVKALFG